MRLNRKEGRHGSVRRVSLPKCPTGVQGLDEITSGGLPRGRPTLVCGSAGCGKTLLGMEFLVRGATQFNEPGVCVSFEETAEELSANMASLGFEIDHLVAEKKLVIDFVFLDRGLVEEAGDYDLEGLFVRLGQAVDSVGAKRVMIDSVESLFAGLQNESILRSELRRLFRWLKQRKLTAVITGERGQGALTRHGLEEYISDCVILLDHQEADAIFTRQLRVVKYRGSTHGTNEYPFLIEDDGISVLPVTSMELNHTTCDERISSGVAALDGMLGGQGYFRGSSILVSGTAGTGKSSVAAQFVNAACARGERCVFFSFEESPSQMLRNMRSIGIDLERWITKGLLEFHAARPTTYGLEAHLVKIHKIVSDFDPRVIVMDPVSALLQSGTRVAACGMLLRIIDFLKQRQVTTLMTNLTSGAGPTEQTDIAISSLMDIWLLLRDIENAGERNRGLYVLKARGIAHSNQIREFLLTDHGIVLREAYLGEGGLLTGSARVAQESRDASAAMLARQEIDRKQTLLERKRKAIDAQIAVLQLELEAEEQESKQLIAQEEVKLKKREQDRGDMARSRALNTVLEGNGSRRVARGMREARK